MKTLLKSLALSVLAVFLPIQSMMITVAVLIVADLVSGILASRKQGIPITSGALRRTISKLLVYELALMLGYLGEHYLIGDAIAVSKLVAGMIGVVELQSIYENLDIINGSPILASIIAKLGSQNDNQP